MDQKTGLCTGDDRFQDNAPSINDPQRVQSGMPTYGPETANVDLVMPEVPLNIKGKFSYFGIKWDGHDIANARTNEVVRINTVKGNHNVEIRQVNSTFLSASIERASFNVFVNGILRLRVESNGSTFDLKII